jgi:hypothetical protein
LGLFYLKKQYPHRQNENSVDKLKYDGQSSPDGSVHFES